jgi:hypothetical protein
MKCNGNYSTAENCIWFDSPLRLPKPGNGPGKIDRRSSYKRDFGPHARQNSSLIDRGSSQKRPFTPQWRHWDRLYLDATPLPLYFQLAWRTVARLRDGGGSDCLHHHCQRTEGQLPIGPPPLPAGEKSHARADGPCPFETRTFSWGVELCHISRRQLVNVIS